MWQWSGSFVQNTTGYVVLNFQFLPLLRKSRSNQSFSTSQNFKETKSCKFFRIYKMYWPVTSVKRFKISKCKCEIPVKHATKEKWPNHSLKVHDYSLWRFPIASLIVKAWIRAFLLAMVTRYWSKLIMSHIYDWFMKQRFLFVWRN